MTLDGFRERHPDIGVAVSAYQPGGAVTIELLLPDGNLLSVSGDNEGAAWLALLGPGEAVEPEEVETKQESVFD